MSRLISNIYGTIAGIFKLGGPKTVTAGSGQDYSTLQAAIDDISLANGLTITVSDTRNEQILIENKFGEILIQGDTRALAGASFFDNTTIQSDTSAAGSGTAQISVAGAVITVTGSTTNPDFSTLSNGDKVVLYDGGGTGSYQELTVQSVSTNTITCTSSPTVNPNGTTGALVILPNKRIYYDSTGYVIKSLNSGEITFKGFHIEKGVNGSETDDLVYVDTESAVNFQNCVFENASDTNTLYVQKNSYSVLNADCAFINYIIAAVTASRSSTVECDKCGFIAKYNQSGSYGIAAENSSYVQANYITNVYSRIGIDSAMGSSVNAEYSRLYKTIYLGMFAHRGSVINATNAYADGGTYGLLAQGDSSVFCDSANVRNMTSYGIRAGYLGYINAISTVSYNNVIGFQVDNGSSILALGATAQNNSVYGYFALNTSFLNADNTNANNSGNGTNYSPATSGVEGNNDGTIFWD